MYNITKTIPINISRTPELVKNVFIGAIAHQRMFRFILPSSKNLYTFSLVHMRDARHDLELSNMRLKDTPLM